MPVAQGFKRKGLIQIFWAQPPVSTDHPYLKPSEISGNLSLFLKVYQTSNACVCMKERGHITPEMLYVSQKTGPSNLNLSISENTFGSEGLHLLQFADGWVLFSNRSEVLQGFRYIHYALLLLLENTQRSRKREGGFSFLPQLVGCHSRAGVRAMS